MKEEKKQQALLNALRELLIKGKATTQDHMCLALQSQGYEVNQSKVSRLLRKIKAVKVVNALGQTIYSLPKEPVIPTVSMPLKLLIMDIVFNETLIVIFTSPGCASMVARILDNQINSEILGTIAGDDTIFVAPKSIHNLSKVVFEIKRLFQDTSTL